MLQGLKHANILRTEELDDAMYVTIVAFHVLHETRERLSSRLIPPSPFLGIAEEDTQGGRHRLSFERRGALRAEGMTGWNFPLLAIIIRIRFSGFPLTS